MNYLNLSAMMLAVLISTLMACHSHDHTNNGGHSHGQHTHSPVSQQGSHDAPILGSLSFTHRSAHSELFVEFSPMVVGTKSRFAVHFTDMITFKAIETGLVEIALIENDNTIDTDTSGAPSSPGIFQLVLTPSKTGAFDLRFILHTTDLFDTIIIRDLMVYESNKQALSNNPTQPAGNEISFLKEQAWRIDFAIEQVKQKNISNVIRSSGEIQAIKGEEFIISAKQSGIIIFENKSLTEGAEIDQGTALFTLNSKGLVKANLQEQFQAAKARFDQTKGDFDRAEKLMQQQVIGQKEFEIRKMRYAVAEAEFKTLSNTYSPGGHKINAPLSGIVKNILVRNGQFVEEGMPLVIISNVKRLRIQADVSQKYLPLLSNIKSANFKTSYQDQIESIENYNGKFISYGKNLEQGQKFIPLIFELDNLQKFIPGTFVDLYLLAEPVKNTLVIPKLALMRDYGDSYVYVQTGGESFEKRELKLGIDDGVNIQVLSGLLEGEWLVTKGAYQIKMASMSTAIPAHGHSH